MTTMKKIINLLLIILCVFCLTSCKTIVKYKYIYPDLPEFSLERPKAPELTPIPEGITYDETLKIMSIDLVRLMDSNDQHVLYENAFLEFYEKIRQDMKDQDPSTGE